MAMYPKSRFRLLPISSVSLLVLVLQACTMVGPDYQPPAISTPDTWAEKISKQVAQGKDSSLQSWWTIFNDPVLDNLIEQCRQENLDIKISISRIRQSRAMLAIAKGEEQPLANAAASATRSKLSDDGELQQVAPADGFSGQNVFQLGLDAGWEIDVFGRVRRTIEAAGAGYQASIEDYRDVLVTLFAEVAMAYLDARTAQQQIAIARSNAEDQSHSLALTQDRYNSGISSKLDVVQAKANLAVTQAAIPPLDIAYNQAVNRLAVLLGQNAGSLQDAFTKTAPIPKPAKSIDAGVPADVLRQRPDIRKAERLLAAQTAEIGVATASLYPRFGLSGVFGLQSRTPGNLFDSSSVTWGFGLPVQWNIFSGGRVRGNIKVQEEIAQQLLLQYQNKVLAAIEEVDNAIMAYNLNRQRLDKLQEATEASREAVDLVLVQYDTGLTDFNNVLVTQRDFYSQQSQQLATEAQAILNIVSLYKALGGGWDLQLPSVEADSPGRGEE